MKLEYIFAMANPFTFDIPVIRLWVEKQVIGKTLNVFCGKSHLSNAVNCDIDPKMNPDVVIDALKLSTKFGPRSFDTAVIDPPYSFHQANINYNGNSCHKITAVRSQLRKIVTFRLIWFGWNIPGTPGFDLKEILLVGHGGSHNATICCVEDRIGTSFTDIDKRENDLDDLK